MNGTIRIPLNVDVTLNELKAFFFEDIKAGGTLKGYSIKETFWNKDIIRVKIDSITAIDVRVRSDCIELTQEYNPQFLLLVMLFARGQMKKAEERVFSCIKAYLSESGKADEMQLAGTNCAICGKGIISILTCFRCRLCGRTFHNRCSDSSSVCKECSRCVAAAGVVLESDPDISLSDLPPTEDVIRAYSQYETEVRQVNTLPDAEKLRYARVFSRQPQQLLERDIGLGPSEFLPGVFGLMLFEMTRRTRAKPPWPDAVRNDEANTCQTTVSSTVEMTGKTTETDLTSGQKVGIGVCTLTCMLPALEVAGFGFGLSMSLREGLVIASIGAAIGGAMLCPRPIIAGLIGGLLSGLCGVYGLFLYAVSRSRLWKFEVVVVLGLSILPGIGCGLFLKKLITARLKVRNETTGA